MKKCYICLVKRFVVIISALLICNLASLFVSFEATSSDEHNEVVLSSDCAISQSSGSSPMILNETNYVSIVFAKVNQTTPTHEFSSEAHVRDSHIINAVITLCNTRFIGFSRSVDKYIYALRRIII